MGVARWEWEQEAQAIKIRADAATDLRRLHLQLSQAEAAARLQVVQTEIEARNAEIDLLTLETGSASRLLVTDQAMMRKLRHADDEVVLPFEELLPPRTRGRRKSHNGGSP